jgi:tetratricopeptide (TPR) repeat protein
MWENTLVKIPLQTIADFNNMAEIQKRLIDKPEKNADLLFQAAAYYYATKRDIQQAKTWVEAAEKLDDKNFSIPNLAQKIYADLGDYPTALAAAQRALALAEKEKLNSAIKDLTKRIVDFQKIRTIVFWILNRT